MNDTQRLLTKADILQGKGNVQSVFFEELGGALPLAPLDSGQWAKVQAVRCRGMEMMGNPKEASKGHKGKNDLAEGFMMRLDLEAAAEADAEADHLAVMYSLNNAGQEWTLDEVKKIQPPGVITAIAKQVLKISRVEKEDLAVVHSFRPKQ